MKEGESITEIIETGRLILRILNEADAGNRLNFYNVNKKFLGQSMPVYAEDFFTLEYQTKRIRYEKELRDLGKEFRYFIFKEKKIIGNVSVSNIIRGNFQNGFLGYSVDENETGKGFATEAVSSVIKIAFKDLKLHRLEANVMPANTASIKVLQKLNFIKEGYSEKYLEINNVWEDHIRFALLNK